MPARRSRTLQWRRCLDQVHERGGTIEIAVVRHSGSDDGNGDGSHLVWRVRLLELTPDEIHVESPMALGEVIPLKPGVELIAILAIGQNRWMFETTIFGVTEHRAGSRVVRALRLPMPTSVERCQRRNYYRMETGALSLPEVEVWPLLDPRSVLVAERASELQFRERGGPVAEREAPADDEAIMPDVGPKFTGMLLNIGGGGIGLRIRPEDAQALGHHKLFWLRFTLPPEMTTPICATGKLVHTNVDSSQHTYAGMAFDFSFNPAHQHLVVEQICRYISVKQRAQLDSGEKPPMRKTA